MDEKEDQYANEKWKNVPIPPYDKSYLISDYGRIKTIRTGHIKALQKSSTDYQNVKLDIGKANDDPLNETK